MLAGDGMKTPREIEDQIRPFVNNEQLPAKITEEELIGFLKRLRDEASDVELDHVYADLALPAHIGSHDVAQEFFRVTRYYA